MPLEAIIIHHIAGFIAYVFYRGWPVVFIDHQTFKESLA
jgi:hypothetical protein